MDTNWITRVIALWKVCTYHCSYKTTSFEKEQSIAKVWRFSTRLRSSSPSGRKTNRVCQPCYDQYRGKLCPNWKRTFGYRFCHGKIPSRQFCSSCHCSVRPQTTWDHRPRTTLEISKTTAGNETPLGKYDITVKYQKGKEMHIADTLSRAYLPVAVSGKVSISPSLLTALKRFSTILLRTILYKFFVGPLFKDGQSPQRTSLQR